MFKQKGAAHVEGHAEEQVHGTHSTFCCRVLGLSLTVLPWGWKAVLLNGDDGSAVPPLHSQIQPQPCPCALLRPGPSPQLRRHTLSLTANAELTSTGAEEDTSANPAVGPLWGAKGSCGLTSNFRPLRLSWRPARHRQGVTFFWSQSLPCFSLGSGKNRGPVTHHNSYLYRSQCSFQQSSNKCTQ